MAATATVPFVPTKAIKSFGPVGPKYEVGLPLRVLPDGDWMIGFFSWKRVNGLNIGCRIYSTTPRQSNVRNSL